MMRITNVRGRRVSSLLCVSECKNVVKAILIRSVLVFLLVAPSACVGITGWPPDQVTIDPCNPTSSDIVTITLSGTWDNSCVPNDVNVSTDGNDIYFDVIQRYPPGTECATVQTPWSRIQSVGPLPAGSYKLMSCLIQDSNAPTPYVLVASFDVRPAVETATFTTNTLIASDDHTYDGNNIIIDGCTLTVNGEHLFNNLQIINGGILTHSAAPSGDPNNRLDLIIMQDLTVDSNSMISAEGKGYSAAQGPEPGTSNAYSNGGGGGHGGRGGSRGSIAGGSIYGLLTHPEELGSGGGYGRSSTAGGTGGGVIELNIGGTFTLDGILNVNGTDGASRKFGLFNPVRYGGGGGSGGSIYVVAGKLAGSGAVSANGGNGGSASGGAAGGGGGGRVALCYEISVFNGQISATGGAGLEYGGAGTIYQESAAQTSGILQLNNGGHLGATTPLLDAANNFDDVNVTDGAILEIPSDIVLTINADAFSLHDGGTILVHGELNHGIGVQDKVTRVEIDSGSVLTVSDGGLINCDELHVLSGGEVEIEGTGHIYCGWVDIQDGELRLNISDNGLFRCDELNISSGGSVYLNGTGPIDCGQVDIGDGTFCLDTSATFSGLHIASGGVLTHSEGQAGFDLTITGDLVVDAGGAIDANGLGHGPASGPGAGGSVSVGQSSAHGGGAGYGGKGGDASGAGGVTYPDLMNPEALGSGGGNTTWFGGMYYYTEYGGAGGGKIHLKVDGVLTVDGSISADGALGERGSAVWGGRWSGGGGAGGSVLLDVAELSGSGLISADGGDAGWAGSGGGGGGGRIALYFDTYALAGSISAQGGSQRGEDGTVYTIPADGELQLNKQTLGFIETPYSVYHWHFSAVVGQLVRFNLINASDSDIIFDLTGPNDWSGFAGISDDSDLVTLPVSGSYTLTARGTGGANGKVYSFMLEAISVTDLPLGTTFTGAFVGNGQAQLFRVNIPESKPLKVVLDDSSGNNSNELYLKYGLPPTRGDYDHRYSKLASPDQQVVVPTAYAGDWYILVYGNHIPTPSDYTLLATTSDVILTSVTPDHHGNSTDAVLTLTGAGFNSAVAVELISDSNDVYPADSNQASSLTQMNARFAAGTVPAGIYSLRVSASGGDSDELPGAFEIAEGGKANFKTNLIVPSVIGQNSQATIYVDCANTGEVAMPSPVLVVTATDRAQIRLAPSLPQFAGPLKVVVIPRIGDTAAGFWTSAQPIGFSSTVHVLASGETPGIVQPGESFRLPVDFIGLERPWNMRDSSVRFDLGVLHPGNTDPVNWEDFKDQMRPESISEEAWEPLWDNFVAQTGNTWGDYVEMLTDNATYLGSLGLKVTDIRELLAFEFAQANGLSVVPYLSLSTDAYVEAPGLTLSFRRVYPNNIVARHAFGALGYGWSHNWDISLEVAEDGTVTIAGPAGSRRVFQPDTRGGYFAEAGDYATLVALGGGAFSLREKGGLLYTFHADGKLSYVEDTNGNRITAVYSAGLLQTLTHSSGQSLDITHNPSGLIETITDPNTGRQTVFTYYVADEHLKEAKYFDGSIVRYDYIAGTGIASAHALKEVQSCCSRRVFNYDVLGRLNETYLGDFEEKVSLSYDAAGTVLVSDAFGNTFKLFYDHRDALAKTENPLGYSMQMTYDSMYNLTSITDPTGRSYFYEYDATGSASHLTDPLGSATRFSYDSPYSRLTSLIDAKGNTTDYQYDASGNLFSITYDDGSVESWSYDDPTSPGDANSWTNRRGVPIKYEYDSSGRLVSKIYADGSRADYEYERGNLTSATNDYGTITLAYDANDRLERINYPEGQFLAFTYHAAGKRSSSTDQAGHRLDYHYDGIGRLERITNESATDIVRYYYDAAGRLERKVLGNGVYTTYDYDGTGQLTSLTNFNPDYTVLSQFDYTYDSRGRRTSMTKTYGSGILDWTYEYDDAGQLIHAVLDSTDPEIPDQNDIYVYDPLGNRIATVIDGATTVYVTNSMNQYSMVGNTGFEYDKDGNLVKKDDPNHGVTAFAYNDENRLVQVNSPEGVWQYAYCAFGNRTRVNDNGLITDYVIDPVGFGNVVGEYDDSGDLLAHYDHGFGLLSQTHTAGDSAYYTFDAISSTSEMTDSDGLVLNSYVYQPFGETSLSRETVCSPFEFVGEYGVMHETNGLDYMRARYYDRQVGRFVSSDPINIYGGDMNLFRYVGNIPTEHFDPVGLWDRIITPLGNFWFDPKSGRVAVSPEAGLDLGWHIDISDPEQWGFGASWSDWYNNWGYEPHCTPPEHGGYFNFEAWFVGEGTASTIYYNPGTQMPLSGNTEILRGYGLQGGFHIGWTFELPITIPGSILHWLDSLNGLIPKPRDPNKKVGPKGVGSRGYVIAGSLMPYRVEFENDPNATAPAQIVEITDPLDSNLDWATFELTEIGFGDHLIAIPENTQHFEATVPMDYNGVNFEVHIEAGIHLATGEVYAKFYSIDPNTSLPPTVDVGFLPPENGTGRGMGHFSYVVNTEPNLPTGTEIRNVAYITFDFIETIATNQIDPHDAGKGTDPEKECLNTIAILNCDIESDLNGDCEVTLGDFEEFAGQWRKSGDADKCLLSADLAGEDCEVGWPDLKAFALEWLKTGISF